MSTRRRSSRLNTSGGDSGEENKTENKTEEMEVEEATPPPEAAAPPEAPPATSEQEKEEGENTEKDEEAEKFAKAMREAEEDEKAADEFLRRKDGGLLEEFDPEKTRHGMEDVKIPEGVWDEPGLEEVATRALKTAEQDAADFTMERRMTRVGYTDRKIEDWWCRLSKGGAHSDPELEETMKKACDKILNAPAGTDLDDLVEKELPEGYVDSNDPEDPSSKAYWKKKDDEYWKEAVKDVYKVIEMYNDYDLEVKQIRDLRKALDDIATTNFEGSEYLEIHRRRVYFQQQAESDPLFSCDGLDQEPTDPDYGFPFMSHKPDTDTEKVFSIPEVPGPSQASGAAPTSAPADAPPSTQQEGEAPPDEAPVPPPPQDVDMDDS